MSRSSKKSRTILFEVKQNFEKPVEVAHSLNIIALKKSATSSKIASQPSENNNSKTSLIDNFFKKQRREKRNPKISIQVKSGSILDEVNEENYEKILFPDPNEGYPNKKGWMKEEASDILDRLKREHKIIIDKQKGKLTCHVEQFSNLCNDFITKISDLQTQKTNMCTKIKKYQSYFKELKVRENCESPEKIDKNAQLKILNLERKVQTLNYIIKNYRNNNKEEIKNFQKKINDYKPTLEADLVNMLATANLKNQQLQNQIDYFQKECETYYKNGNWVEIVRKMQQKDGAIAKVQAHLAQVKAELQDKNQKAENYHIISENLANTQKQLAALKKSEANNRKEYEMLRKQKLAREVQYNQLERDHEELTFKYEGLLSLEEKIIYKQEQIHKNSLTIARLQSQNYCLKVKLEASIQRQNSQVFANSQYEINQLQVINTKINELSTRFAEQLQNQTFIKKFSSESEIETVSFIMHLFQKVKQSYEKIVDCYMRKINEFCLQNRELNSLLDAQMEANKKKIEQKQRFLEEIQCIMVKRKRCMQGVQRLSCTNENCSMCNSWILHWGQLNTLCDQLYNAIQDPNIQNIITL